MTIKKKYTEAETRKIIQLHKAGKSINEISKQVGRTENSLNYFIYRRLKIGRNNSFKLDIDKIKKEEQVWIGKDDCIDIHRYV